MSTFKDTPQVIQLDVLFFAYEFNTTTKEQLNQRLMERLGSAASTTAVFLMGLDDGQPNYFLWRGASLGMPRQDRSGTNIESMVNNQNITRWFNKTDGAFVQDQYGSSVNFVIPDMSLVHWSGVHHIDNPYYAEPEDLLNKNQNVNYILPNNNWIFFCNNYPTDNTFSPQPAELIAMVAAYNNKIIRNQTISMQLVTTPFDIKTLSATAVAAPKFVDLEDVKPLIPFLGQAIHYDGAKWSQTPEMIVDPNSKNIVLATTGSIGLTNNGVIDKDISVQSGRELYLQSGTQMTLDAQGGLLLEAGSGGIINFRTNSTDAFYMGTDGILKSQTPTYTALIQANNDIVNKEYVDDAIDGLNVSDKLTIGGDATGVAIQAGTTDDNAMFLIRNSAPFLSAIDDEVTLEASQRLNLNSTGDAFFTSQTQLNLGTFDGPIRFEMGAPPNNILFLGTSFKSAAQYATDVTGVPSAVPNVQYVDDKVGAISGNLVLLDGNTIPDDDPMFIGNNSDNNLFLIAGGSPFATITTDGEVRSVLPNYENLVTSSASDGILVNRKYVTDSIGAIDLSSKLSIGGDAIGATLVAGTTDNQNFHLMRNNVPVIQIDNNLIMTTSGEVDIESILSEIRLIAKTGFKVDVEHGFMFFNVGNLPGDVAAIGTANKSAVQYALDVVGKPYAIPNVQYVTDQNSSVVTLTNKSLVDSTTYFTDDLTPSKRAQFQCSDITAGVTRTYTFPDADGTLVLNTTSIAQGGNLFGTTMLIGTNDNFDVNIRRNNINAFNFNATGITMLPQGATTAFFLRAPSGGGVGGSLSIVGGTGTGSSVNGGSISLIGGNGNVVGGNSAFAGAINLTGGQGLRRNGGDVNLTGGFANDGSTSNLQGGSIVMNTGTCAGGAGATGLRCGDIDLIANSTGSTLVGPGDITLQCKPQTAGNKRGGNITLTASAATGSGTPGSIGLYYTTNLGCTVEGDGTLSTNVASYEALVTSDNDFPNRKFVVDNTYLSFGVIRFANFTTPTSLGAIIALTPFKLNPVTSLATVNGSWINLGNGDLQYTGTGTWNAKITYEVTGNFTNNGRVGQYILYKDGVPLANSVGVIQQSFPDAGGYNTQTCVSVVSVTTNSTLSVWCNMLAGGGTNYSIAKLVINGELMNRTA